MRELQELILAIQDRIRETIDEMASSANETSEVYAEGFIDGMQECLMQVEALDSNVQDQVHRLQIVVEDLELENKCMEDDLRAYIKELKEQINELEFIKDDLLLQLRYGPEEE